MGGKTGIDLDDIKNCIGTFTQPKAVFIEPQFLKTLDERQLISGFAEMMKHGLIADAAYFNDLKETQPQQVSVGQIYRSVAIKNEIVKADPQEQNIRKTLNFGHTIGHAIESNFLQSDTPLLHGEALAMGMICEAYLSYRLNGLTDTELNEICDSMKALFPLKAIAKSNYSQLMDYMQNDKKNQGGKIGFALLNKIGACDYHLYASADEIVESLDYYQKMLA